MNQSVNCKTVVAAAVLCAAANLAFAQDATPTVTVPASSNSEVNPNPLQTNPVAPALANAVLLLFARSLDPRALHPWVPR